MGTDSNPKSANLPPRNLTSCRPKNIGFGELTPIRTVTTSTGRVKITTLTADKITLSKCPIKRPHTHQFYTILLKPHAPLPTGAGARGRPTLPNPPIYILELKKKLPILTLPSLHILLSPTPAFVGIKAELVIAVP